MSDLIILLIISIFPISCVILMHYFGVDNWGGVYMVLIYHYFDFMGKSGLVFDMVTSTEELAEEWIKLYGSSAISYKYERVHYYEGVDSHD